MFGIWLILDIKKMSHVDVSMMSYKLTVWHDAVDKLLQSTSWPEFITCRLWVRPHCYHDDSSHGNPSNDWGNVWDEHCEHWDPHVD